jgi:hypothetical protein
MFQTMIRILKWISVPALTLVALLSCLVGRYEGLMNLTICLGAIVSVSRAAWLKQYVWAAVCVIAVVVFSPLFLLTKIFLLMALTGVAACLMLASAFRPQPAAAL